MLSFKFLDIPTLPFKNFKWKWASLQCTEGINDPVVLLGVLFRMAKLENRYKYSSEEFAQELRNLSSDLEGKGINVDVCGRGGDRNIIRNSGQYWKALKLIPNERGNGTIRLTEFGRKVANHVISQTEFSSTIVLSLKLPNTSIYNTEECKQWKDAGIEIYPLKLILSIILALGEGIIDSIDAYLTPNELIRLVIPLSGTPGRGIDSYVDYIRAYRNQELDISNFPDCCPEANDKRIAREFLLFLAYYGYLNKNNHTNRSDERYYCNYNIYNEIQYIINSKEEKLPEEIISDTERKRVSSQYRPNQAKFRKEVLKACKRCILTNVEMPEVLEAAHILPHKYNGEEIVQNGVLMRLDIHNLFDLNHIRISVNGDVWVSDRVRYSYGASIPYKIILPDYVDKEYIRWRWENYDGI